MRTPTDPRPCRTYDEALLDRIKQNADLPLRPSQMQTNARTAHELKEWTVFLDHGATELFNGSESSVSDADDAGKVHLLAVDDDPDSAELISRIATKCGYDARSITDTRGIDQELSDWKPQVITLDLCMPEMDGMQILSLLQNIGFKGYLVIISGQTETMRAAAQKLAEARGLKVANNLSKPIDLKALSNLLASLQLSG
jgi:two-component system chemotaxis response regulator CheB